MGWSETTTPNTLSPLFPQSTLPRPSGGIFLPIACQTSIVLDNNVEEWQPCAHSPLLNRPRMGRPSDYTPENAEAICAQVVEWGRAGKSKAWMAANLDISRQTLENWAQAHPEFLDAITRAMAHAQAWWEDLGQKNIISAPGASLNSGVYTRSMAARFPDDWREKNATELTGANGGPLQVERIELVPMTGK